MNRQKIPRYQIETFNTGVYCSYAETNQLFSPILHMHNYYEMNLFLEGNITFYIDDEKIIPKRGMLFLINNTQIHGPSALKSKIYKRSIVHFNPRIAKSLSLDNCDLLSCFTQADTTTNNFITLSEEKITIFSNLTKEAEKLSNFPVKFGNEVLKNSILAQLLVLVNNESPQSYSKEVLQSKHSLLVKKILDYIRDHLQDSFSLEQLEEALRMDRHYLNRVFKKEMSLSIYHYTQLKRIGIAKKYIAQGYSPKETASMLAFKDYSTFARAFKSFTGDTPKGYSEKHF